MNEGAAYVYSAVDRLAQPHRYMYTPYEGRPFLEAYFASREAFVGAQHADVDGTEAAIRAALNARSNGWDSPGTTSAQLEVAVRRVLDGASPRDCLDEHLRRYEVSKRLHRTYDGSRGDGDYLGMAPYILLAAGCALATRRGSTLKYLNALLKLGDCIVSRSALLNDAEAALARAALAAERLAVKDLMSAHGVVA